MTDTADGTFEVELRPGAAEVDAAIGRFELSKTFHGGIEGTGVGVMLSAGDPQSGEAGYVAIEVVRGRVGGREGTFALQQFGSMHGGSQTLHYEVVPGSGTGQLAGMTGTVRLDIDQDGTHRYTLEFDL